ncbi:MAG: QsdR family transcriptional regulator [Streptosporangiaceae bacterium]|jgi:AcrR family transcriptional regulator
MAVRAEARDDVRVVLPEGTDPPAAVPPPVFAAALSAYLAGHRLDMQSLARQAGVGRATLYRRAGNREDLLDAVIWWRARRMVARQLRLGAGLSGAARIASVVGGALRDIAADRPLRRFIESDPDTALRILTGGRSAAAAGMTTALERLIDLERSRGSFDAELDSAALAYAVMRISEGFLYADVIAARPPDVERAITVIRALLTGLDRAQRRQVSRG